MYYFFVFDIDVLFVNLTIFGEYDEKMIILFRSEMFHWVFWYIIDLYFEYKCIYKIVVYLYIYFIILNGMFYHFKFD